MGWFQQYLDAIKSNNKRQVLDILDNSLEFSSPGGHLQVCALLKNDDDIKHTTWRYWLDVRDDPWWIEHANNRLIAKIETVLDIDPHTNEPEADFLNRITQIELQSLLPRRIGDHPIGTFSTGSRGIHIHIFRPHYATQPDDMIRIMKMKDILDAGADTAKATLRSMIACELAPHWKTGRPKILLRGGNHD